jgi:phosphonopyruvate decarboxylase
MSLYQDLKKRGFNFFVGVPCSRLKNFIEELQSDEEQVYVPATREDVAMAIAVGAYFCGKKPLVFIQNSGLGHLVNIITSLLKPYKISIHILISVRKHPFEHEFMYKITEDLIKLLEYEDFVTLVE